MAKKKESDRLERMAMIDTLVLACFRLVGVDVIAGDDFAWVERRKIFSLAKVSEDIGQRAIGRLLAQGLIERDPETTKAARYRYVLPPAYRKKKGTR